MSHIERRVTINKYAEPILNPRTGLVLAHDRRCTYKGAHTMKKIIYSVLAFTNLLLADVTYECSNTKLTKDGKTSVTSKKPTMIVTTNWMQKPIMVKIYLRDRSKDIYDRVQFTAINKQSMCKKRSESDSKVG